MGPLAELVNIDPKSIGVSQYLHDVNQSELARKRIALTMKIGGFIGNGIRLRQTQALITTASGFCYIGLHQLCLMWTT